MQRRVRERKRGLGGGGRGRACSRCSVSNAPCICDNTIGREKLQWSDPPRETAERTLDTRIVLVVGRAMATQSARRARAVAPRGGMVITVTGFDLAFPTFNGEK